MLGARIHHSVILAIILVNTASGKEVGRIDTVFYRTINGIKSRIYPIHKDGGSFILGNMEKYDFLLSVECPGFEPIDVDVCFEKIDPGFPVFGVYLTPSNDNLMDDLITVCGHEDGLKEIMAVDLNEIFAHGERYDKRRQMIITFENNLRLNQCVSPFGVLSPGLDSYEVVFIDRLPRPNEAKLRKPFEGEFVRNCSLIRIHYGQVDSNGDFTFRIYSRGQPMDYLFRVVTDEGITFKRINVREMEDDKWHLQ